MTRAEAKSDLSWSRSVEGIGGDDNLGEIVDLVEGVRRT